MYARTVDSAQLLDRRRGAVQTALAVASIQAFDYSVSPWWTCWTISCSAEDANASLCSATTVWSLRRLTRPTCGAACSQRSPTCPTQTRQGLLACTLVCCWQPRQAANECHVHRSVCERHCRWHMTAMMGRSARVGSRSSHTQWRWPSSWRSCRWTPCLSSQACCMTQWRTATRCPLTR